MASPVIPVSPAKQIIRSTDSSGSVGEGTSPPASVSIIRAQFETLAKEREESANRDKTPLRRRSQEISRELVPRAGKIPSPVSREKEREDEGKGNPTTASRKHSSPVAIPAAVARLSFNPPDAKALLPRRNSARDVSSSGVHKELLEPIGSSPDSPPRSLASTGSPRKVRLVLTRSASDNKMGKIIPETPPESPSRVARENVEKGTTPRANSNTPVKVTGVFTVPLFDSGWITDLKKAMKSSATRLIQKTDIEGSVRLFCMEQINPLFTEKRNLDEVTSGDLALEESPHALTMLESIRTDGIILKPFHDRLKEVLHFVNRFIERGKISSKLENFKICVTQLLKMQDILAFRNYICEEIASKDLKKLLSVVLSGCDTLDEHVLPFFKKWHGAPALGFIRTVYHSMRWLVLQAQNIKNYEFIWKENANDDFIIRNIYRQDIVRAQIPEDKPYLNYRVLGFLDGKPYDEKILFGSKLGETKDEAQKTFFTHLIYTLNQLGMDPKISDEQFTQEVEGFLRDKEKQSASLHLLQCETILQLCSMKAWGYCDHFVRSLFPIFNKPPYITKASISEDCCIEILNRENFRVTRSANYTVYKREQREDGTYWDRPNRDCKVANFNFQWSVSVNKSENEGLPVGTLSILNWETFEGKMPGVTIEDKFEILKGVVNFNPDYKIITATATK